MDYVLSNTNTECLLISDNFTHIEVLNNDFLPYPLKDFVETTSNKDFQKSLKDISVVRDYLAARTLNLSRENAKTILNVAAMPQSLKTEDRLKIVLACRGLTMEDNFWLKKAGESISFEDVNLRQRHLFERSYDIAILGRHVSATVEEITPDLMTQGMFPKFWRRTNGDVELWKADKTNGVNVDAEVLASRILDASGYDNHVKYRKEQYGEFVFSVSKCFTNNEYSYVTATDLRDWCVHTGQKLSDVLAPFHQQFSDMCVIDYVLANTDRHFDNWGVLVSNETNEMVQFAPLYDMNQSLIADEFRTEIGDLLYEPTGMTFDISVVKFGKDAAVRLNADVLPNACLRRLDFISGVMGRENSERTSAMTDVERLGRLRTTGSIREIIAAAEQEKAKHQGGFGGGQGDGGMFPGG